MTSSKLKADRVPGLFIRTSKTTGAKSYVVVVRDRDGKQIWQTIGSTELFGRDEARDLARNIIKAIKSGKDHSRPESFPAVVEDFMKRHVQKKGLRSESEIRRNLDKTILPAWRSRDFTDISRKDIAKLLDEVEDKSGPVAADSVLAFISMMTRWYAARHDTYVSPVVPGMRRSNPKERAGSRIFTDDELRLVWEAAEANGLFGAFVRLALLTGQRREKIASMKWTDIENGVWTVPAEAREKGTPGALVLPPLALEIIEAQPRYQSNPYVFAVGSKYLTGFSKAKDRFDAKVRIAPWRIHDLRRTARSLMAGAGVEDGIAELVLGHGKKGVEGIYNRFKYRDEKAAALLRLQYKIAEIVTPPPQNVLAFGGKI
jgi:integrase